MQLRWQNNKGIIMFGAVVLVFLAACIFAYVVTGDKGIEERFSSAVGLPAEAEEDDGGFLGFAIEGNILYYLVILAVILGVTAALYVKYKV